MCCLFVLFLHFGGFHGFVVCFFLLGKVASVFTKFVPNFLAFGGRLVPVNVGLEGLVFLCLFFFVLVLFLWVLLCCLFVLLLECFGVPFLFLFFWFCFVYLCWSVLAFVFLLLRFG